MANIITVPLPKDLPTNWVYGQTIGPQGTDVGLTQQHGYNYLMEQVNAAQQAAQEIENSIGNVNGIASLGENGQVPYAQMPHLTAGKTIYVAATGNDSNPGTQDAPFGTINGAISTLPKDLGGFVVNILVINGYQRVEDVLIEGFSNGILILKLQNQDGSYFDIQTFTIKHTDAGIYIYNAKTSNINLVRGPGFVVFWSCYFDGSDIEDNYAVGAVEGSHVGFYSCAFYNCNNCVTVATVSECAFVSCTGSNNTTGVNAGTTLGCVIIIQNSSFGAQTEIVKFNGSIVYKDGVPV